MHRRLIPLMNMAFAETNPGPMKAVMDLIGVNARGSLLPWLIRRPRLQSGFAKKSLRSSHSPNELELPPLWVIQEEVKLEEDRGASWRFGSNRSR